jgi:hypothetical protein
LIIKIIVLVGGGGQDGGFDALDYQKIKHGDAGKLGNYPILSYLPDKIARFVYEFHAFRFESLDLPPLPAATLMCMGHLRTSKFVCKGCGNTC